MAIANEVQPLSTDRIRSELAELDRNIPWTHHFDLHGVETITMERDEKFYKKAMGLKKIGALGLKFCRIFTEGRDLATMRVLDVASGEGGISVAFAQAGAGEVLGIEGRQLYVERAQFVARALNVQNVMFTQGDVRKIDHKATGQFDFVIASGILHHLGQDDFSGFLASMANVTRDTLFLYTHVSTPDAIRDFRMKGPVTIADGSTGYLFREHTDDATPEEREKQVRASLDNTFSFWATEEALIRALTRVGFKLITKVFEPHAYSGYTNRNLRIILIAKK